METMDRKMTPKPNPHPGPLPEGEGEFIASGGAGGDGFRFPILVLLVGALCSCPAFFLRRPNLCAGNQKNMRDVSLGESANPAIALLLPSGEPNNSNNERLRAQRLLPALAELTVTQPE